MGTGLNYTKTNIVKGCEVSRNQLLTYKVFFLHIPKPRTYIRADITRWHG